jgi:hypothetical protein
VAQSLPIILPVCIAVLAGAAYFVVRRLRNEDAAKRRQAIDLGFAPVADAGVLLKHIESVRGRQRPGMLRLSHVFRRDEAPRVLWLYSLRRRDFSEATVVREKQSDEPRYEPVEVDAIALVDRAWNWPRCVATPRIVGQGKLATVAARMADAGVDANARRLDFPNIFDLDEFYFVACYGEVPKLPEAFLQTLATAPGMILHLGGDTLTLAWANSTTRPPGGERTRQLIELARLLARALGGSAA